jgi:molybdopterin-guanine dinucleotide biosynthesis protein A
MRCAAAILAGGRGTRMGGRVKAFLTLEGRRIIDRQLEVLAPLFSEILVSANEPERFADLGLPVVADAVPGCGPLGGIMAVLEAASAPRVFVVACDMPFLTADAVRLIAQHPDEAAAVVPIVAGRPEPLFARYSRLCVGPIRARLAHGDRRVIAFHADVEVRAVTEAELRAADPTLASLTNINRPEDLR